MLIKNEERIEKKNEKKQEILEFLTNVKSTRIKWIFTQCPRVTLLRSADWQN